MLVNVREKREVSSSFPLHSSMRKEVLVHKHVNHMFLIVDNGCLVMNNDYEMVSQKGEMVESSHKSWVCLLKKLCEKQRVLRSQEGGEMVL